MNGNNINDIYVDEEERIWLANYPTGITIRNNRYGRYDLIKHSLGNNRSLVNDQVHDVIEDSDGDLWFATSNGISFIRPIQENGVLFLVLLIRCRMMRIISSWRCVKSLLV